jgi:hypothetical protein
MTVCLLMSINFPLVVDTDYYYTHNCLHTSHAIVFTDDRLLYAQIRTFFRFSYAKYSSVWFSYDDGNLSKFGFLLYMYRSAIMIGYNGTTRLLK